MKFECRTLSEYFTVNILIFMFLPLLVIKDFFNRLIIVLFSFFLLCFFVKMYFLMSRLLVFSLCEAGRSCSVFPWYRIIKFCAAAYLRGSGVLLVQSVVLSVLLLVLQVILVELLAHSFDAVLLHHLILNTDTTRPVRRVDERQTDASAQHQMLYRPAGVWRPGTAASRPALGCTERGTRGGNGWWAPPRSWRSAGRRSRTFPPGGRSWWVCCCLLSWMCSDDI